MPLTITDKRRETISKYLSVEIPAAREARSSREDVWAASINRYEAKTHQKKYPFQGSASVHVPVVAYCFDSIKSRILNALHADKRMIVGTAISNDPVIDEMGQPIINPNNGQPITWRDIAELLEQYLSFEISEAGDINFVEMIDELFDEVGLLGTGFIKVIWCSEISDDYYGDGSRVRHTSFDNIKLVVPSLEDIFVPPGYPDLTRIPWITHKYRLRAGEIVARGESYGWDKKTIKELIKAGGGDAEIGFLEESQDAVEGVSYNAGDTAEWDVAETWLRIDLDGTGRESRILVDHLFSDPSKIFRIIPWPYKHGQLPYHVARYIRRRKRLYGMGIPERLESLDEAVSTNVNQMLDNATLANTRLWSVAEDSRAAQELDVIWPGKKIPRGSADDITPMQMGEVYPSAFETYNILVQNVEKVSKLTDYNLGRESQALGRQSTATATMALLQESGQYFDNVTRDLRAALNAVLQQMVDLIVQYKPMMRVIQVLGPVGAILVEVLGRQNLDIRQRLAIQVAFSSDASTRELARQEEMTKNQFIRGYYQDLLQLAMQRFNPQTPAPIVALIDEIAVDGDLRIKSLLEKFGENYTTASLPNFVRIMNSVPPGPGPGFQLQQALAPPGADEQPGMGGDSESPEEPALPGPLQAAAEPVLQLGPQGGPNGGPPQ
jgi:hypothetical protein